MTNVIQDSSKEFCEMISGDTQVEVIGGDGLCIIKVTSSSFESFSRSSGRLEASSLTALSLRIESIDRDKAFIRIHPHIQLESNKMKNLGPTGSNGELFVVDLSSIADGKSLKANFLSSGGLWKTMPSSRLTEFSSYLEYLSSMNLFIPRNFSKRFVKSSRGEFYIRLKEPSFHFRKQLVSYLEASEERPNFGTLLYFSGVTIATIGYGDIYPKSDVARLLVFIEALLGVILVGYMTTRLYDFFKGIREAKLEKSNDKAKVVSSRMLLEPFIEKFFEDLSLMLMPLSSSKHEGAYTFNDLANMYKEHTPHTIGALLERPYVRFLDSCLRLSEMLQTILLRVDTIKHPELGEKITECIASIERYDYLSAFNNKLKTGSVDELAYKTDIKMLRDYVGKPEFKDSNMINLYVSFWNMIQVVGNNLKWIEKYVDEL